MQAIKLDRKNLQTIIDNAPLTRAQLENVMAHWSDLEKEDRYFIPEFVNQWGKNTGSWAVPVKKYMEHHFNFDAKKAETEFVELEVK